MCENSTHDGSTDFEFTLGDQLMSIPLILEKILTHLDFATLKNSRLAGNHSLLKTASLQILHRNLCKPIRFIYDESSDLFRPRNPPQDPQPTLPHLSAPSEFTSCFKNSLHYSHTFPCTTSYEFKDPARLSHPDIQNFLSTSGPFIKSLYLEEPYVLKQDGSPSSQEVSCLFNLFQIQAPNIQRLSLGDLYGGFYNSILIETGFTKLQLVLRALKYFSPNFYSLKPAEFENSIVCRILKGSPNLAAVEPFRLKFVDCFLSIGKLHCVKQCMVLVDGGASTCWDNDPTSDSYESFHGTRDEDFQKFIQNIHIYPGKPVQLKRFRIFVSHWVFKVEELLHSAYEKWLTPESIQLLNSQKDSLLELGDIPLDLFLSAKLPLFSKLRFLSIRELPKTVLNLFQNLCLEKRDGGNSNLQSCFPTLESVRFVQMYKDAQEVAEEEEGGNIRVVEEDMILSEGIGSVQSLELRYGCRNDSGLGIEKPKLLSSLFPNVTRLTLNNTEDIGLILRTVFEYFPKLTSLCFHYIHLTSSFECLDSILTGFEEGMCERLWEVKEKLVECGGKILNFEGILPEGGEVEQKRSKSSLLCLKDLKTLELRRVYCERGWTPPQSRDGAERSIPFSVISSLFAFSKMKDGFQVIVKSNDSNVRTAFQNIGFYVKCVDTSNQFREPPDPPTEFWHGT